MALAINSLPVPVSPNSSTEALQGATRRVIRYTSCIAGAGTDDAGDGRSRGIQQCEKTLGGIRLRVMTRDSRCLCVFVGAMDQSDP